MCVIAISPAGCRQPSEKDFRAMWEHNPHGAGVMWCSRGKVHIRKGFMTFDGFMHFVKARRFTVAAPVVYHFRISTQAGVNPAMTHPFPLTSDAGEHLKLIPCPCSVGVAHNGIIPLTTDATETRFSDTSLFIQHYLTRIIRTPEDIDSPEILEIIGEVARSKFALLRGDGKIATVGQFYRQTGGYMVSNEFYKPVSKISDYSGWSYNYSR